MRVELPDVLSVLAHELRSPLSVVQGYIRLLQRQRDPDDPQMAMLSAMLEASGRLTALGRQAADLSSWLHHQDAGPERPGASLQAVREELVKQAPTSVAIQPVTSGADEIVAGHGAAATLAAACLTVAQLAMRECAQTSAGLTLTRETPDTVIVRIDVGPNAAPDASIDQVSQTVPFDRGGLGLSLVMASHILAAQGATALATRNFDRVEIRWRTAQGSAS